MRHRDGARRRILRVIVAVLAYAAGHAASSTNDETRSLELDFNLLCYYAALGSASTADSLAFELAARASSAACARITIDGYPANFILEAHIAAAMCRMHNWTNVIAHGERALTFRSPAGMAGAPERMSRLLMDMARAYSSADVQRYDKADDYRAWAGELDPRNEQLSQKLELEAAHAARRRRRPDEEEAILRAAIARHGFAKRMLYMALDRLLWQAGRGRDACELWLAQLKEARLDFHEDNEELGIDKLWQSLPLAEEHHVYACMELLRTLPARYPATVEYAPYIGALEAIAKDQRLQLEALLRKAAHEHTAEMEAALRAALAGAVPAPRRLYLYLGDNLCARGRYADAIGVWLEGMAAAADPRDGHSGDWFAQRIINHRAHASTGQMEECAALLERRARAAQDARAVLAMGGQLEMLGFPDRAIATWLHGLAQQPRPYIQTPGGDWFMQKLDERLTAMTDTQKRQYADVIAALIAKWRERPDYRGAVQLLEAKRAAVLP